MAAAQKITRDNFTTLLVRSTQGRSGTPDGNVFFDTTNDTIELITREELAQVDLGSGLEDNPFTNADKMQNLALYFFTLQEVEADATLQGFRTALDAVVNRMGRLVGATAFLNAITLATNTSTTNNDDRDKLADSGFTEFLVDGTIQKVFHGVGSLNPINATTQPYYLLASSTSEADRQAATPIDFTNTGDINDAIQTFENGGTDNRNSVLIVCAREFGYTIGEADSVATGVAELGAYFQGYGVGNEIVPSINALSIADVYGGSAVAPWSNMTFFRHATPQTRSGFAAGGAGASGDFTDEIQLSSGTMDITQLRAFLDALMLQDTDENANTGATGVFRPKRAEPLYTIDPASAKLVTRAGIYVDPAKLTAAAQQQIIQTNDSGGQHFIPSTSGITGTVSDAWKNDSAPWHRMLYVDAAGSNDYDTENARTVPDSSGNPIAGDATDARLTGNTFNITYAYGTETDGGNVTANTDQDVVWQFGGVDNTKTRSVFFTITDSANIPVDLTTALETN